MNISNENIKTCFDLGFSLYPNVFKEKRPACPHGYKDATNDQEEFVKLVDSNPEFNIAIATGRVSNVVAIDIDARNGGLESFEELTNEHGNECLKTLTNETSAGGKHLLFKYPKDFQGNFPKTLCIGVDIKADGGGINGPGSTHPSGHVYKFTDREAPILEMPDWMLELASQKRNTPELSTVFTNEGKIAEGQRNNSAYAIGWSLIKEGLPPEQLRMTLHSLNHNLSTKPMSQSEVDGIASSILKKISINTEVLRIPSFSDEKLSGLAGEFVTTLLPHTEACGVGLYLQFLITFGTMIGKRAYIDIGATKHYTGEYLLLIGQSAKGRKGSSMDMIKYVLSNRDPVFFQKNVKGNITSGEGIVEIIKDQTNEKKDSRNTRGVSECRF